LDFEKKREKRILELCLEPTSHWCQWRHWQSHLNGNWGWNHLPITAHFSCDTTG